MCNCYVRHLPEEGRFGIRKGAHEKSCPWYSESKDPVDKLKDDATRKHFAKK